MRAHDDAYVEAEAAGRNTGAADKLVASSTSGMHKQSYLKFAVPALPTGATIASAKLELTAITKPAAPVALHTVASTGWSEASLTYATRPALGAAFASVNAGVGSASFNLTGKVAGARTNSFAFTTDAGVASFVSDETTTTSYPKLVITWKTGSTAAAPTPAPTPAPKPSQPPAPAVSGTRFGTDIWQDPGESYATALAQADANYGRLQIIRYFYAGLPTAWPGNAGLSGRPLIVSFKANPSQILSGSLDATFKNWFAGAPRDRDIFWSYYHEPEDNIAKGDFTAASYRAAWRRLAGLARLAGNSHLKATPILMCWTLDAASHRNWKDYYPGSDVVDFLGWDCYNLGATKGVYKSPADIVAPAKNASASVGKPWGIAEYGSLLVAGDNGTRRAQWLRDSASWFRAQGAAWVTYFDAPVGNVAHPEYRLLDAPSRAAWKSVVSGS